MLILSRKLNECIVIDSRIIVKVVRVEGQIVKLGIQAPQDVPVHRQEIYDEIQRNNQEALTRMRMELPRLPQPIQTDSVTPPANTLNPAPPSISSTPVEIEKSPVSEAPVPPAVTNQPTKATESLTSPLTSEKKTTTRRSSTGAAKAGSTRTKRSKNTLSE